MDLHNLNNYDDVDSSGLRIKGATNSSQSLDLQGITALHTQEPSDMSASYVPRSIYHMTGSPYQAFPTTSSYYNDFGQQSSPDYTGQHHFITTVGQVNPATPVPAFGWSPHDNPFGSLEVKNGFQNGNYQYLGSVLNFPNQPSTHHPTHTPTQLEEPFDVKPQLMRQASQSSYTSGASASTLSTPVTNSPYFTTPGMSSVASWTYSPQLVPLPIRQHTASRTPTARGLYNSTDFLSPSRKERGHYATHTYPLGARRPSARVGLSDSSISQSFRPTRIRARSTGNTTRHTPTWQMHGADRGMQQQMPLPIFDGYNLTASPQVVYEPEIPQTIPQTDQYSTTVDTTLTSDNDDQRTNDVPSSPPPSDLEPSALYSKITKDEPLFEGDLYTPRYRRRSTQNKESWEGWCGHCKPGRWLNLKNSRYWDDKQKNHGICCKTKVRFDDPVDLRLVSDEGSAFVETIYLSEPNTPVRAGMKREGLCGVCYQWIAMEGMRGKARQRQGNWWNHAYECHKHLTPKVE